MVDDQLIESRGFRVFGRVQGVGFRWWTAREATRLGLAGSVRNVADGTVEIRARGPAGALEELARRLQRGPRTALVRRVDAFPIDAVASDRFEIRR